MRKSKKSQNKDGISTALAAVALQDHLLRSLSLGGHCRSSPVASVHKLPTLQQHSRALTRNRAPKCGIDTKLEREYVLDNKPQPLTLAQKLGLVDAPPQLLSEEEWKQIKEKACQRQDFKQPCVICKEELGLQQHVLLSCTHVFHKNCLQSFERFTGHKTCPMCRKKEYQTRVVHEGVRHLREKSAVIIQAAWRGYVVRSWYLKLRQTVPPKDPKLRSKFYEEKLKVITDRMLKSLDTDINGFLSEIDKTLEESRNVFRQFDSVLRIISDGDWLRIEAKAIERGDTECPICLMQLDSCADICRVSHVQCGKKINLLRDTVETASTHDFPNRKSSGWQPTPDVADSCTAANPYCLGQYKPYREIVLLSCSHIFHLSCLQALEEFAVGSSQHVCPVCRSHYQTKTLSVWSHS